MLAWWNSERTFHRAALQQWLCHYFTGQGPRLRKKAESKE